MWEARLVWRVEKPKGTERLMFSKLRAEMDSRWTEMNTAWCQAELSGSPADIVEN